MPDIPLKSGRIVRCDEEDVDLVQSRTWRPWWNPRNKVMQPVSEQTSLGRRFRLLLHREVAARKHPAMIANPRRHFVKPLNGDYFDVRRENLAVLTRKTKRGRPASAIHPAGHQVRKCKRGTVSIVNTSPLWAGGEKPKRRKSAYGRFGRVRDQSDPNPVG